MWNYYELLGLDCDSSTEEIKRSFRQKAKELHPDTTAIPGPETMEAMRLLIKAYRTLVDPVDRETYNRSLGIKKGGLGDRGFNYRDFLRRRDDPESLSKLIFFDLLHDYEEEALDLYERVLRRRDYSIEEYLDREDFMDCAFLLAEEYEKKGEYVKSFRLLATLVEYENTKPYFRHFLDEVLGRLRNLAGQKLPLHVRKDEVLAMIERMLDLRLPDRDTAFYCKRAAELCLELDDRESAADYLQRGLRLDTHVQALKKLRSRIGDRAGL